MASSSGCDCTTSSTMNMEYSSVESESEHEELESYRSVVSLMDRLRTPMPADIARSRKVIKMTPPERFFSLLKASFGDQQDSCLQDYVQASLMMQYKKR